MLQPRTAGPCRAKLHTRIHCSRAGMPAACHVSQSLTCLNHTPTPANPPLCTRALVLARAPRTQALYSIISTATPLLMAVHLALTGLRPATSLSCAQCIACVQLVRVLSLSLSVYLYLFVYHAPLRVRSAASTCVHARMLELAVCARARRRPCSSYALRHPTHAHSSLLLSLSCSRPLMYLSCTPRPVCITASAPAARHAMRQGGEQLGLCDYATAATHMSTHYNTH